MSRRTEYPRPSRTLIHISDTHLTGDGAPLYGAVDSQARLRELLQRLAGSGLRPDAIVVSGDVADRGEPAAYSAALRLVEPVAERLGSPVVWVMGNHDRREAFRGAILGQQPSSEPVDYVTWVDGLRIIVLDSTVPDEPLGGLTAEQLTWLADQLRTPAPEGSVLVLHHPPLPTVQDLAVTCELIDQRALAQVVLGSDVRVVLSGHVHYSTFGTFAGIPVSAVAAASYTQDLFMPDKGTRGRDAAQGLGVVELYRDTVVVTAFPLVEGTAVGRVVDGSTSASMLAQQGITIPAGVPLR